MNKFKFVGLGAIGTHIALCLCYTELCKELEVYDFDVVSKKDIDIYPFYKGMEGEKKVAAFRSYMLKSYPDVSLRSHPYRFPEKDIREDGWIVIDSRDTKTLKSDFDFRVSFDGGRLMLDARSKEDIPSNFYTHSSYLSEKNVNALILAAANCCEYIERRLFDKKDPTIYRVFQGSVFKRR